MEIIKLICRRIDLKLKGSLLHLKIDDGERDGTVLFASSFRDDVSTRKRVFVPILRPAWKLVYFLHARYFFLYRTIMAFTIDRLTKLPII